MSHDINVKLPQISIPEFNGSYDRWLQFYDSFTSLIYNNNALTNVQKFYYLQTALKGEASGVIRALEVSDANYLVAWQMLKDRYENKRIIIHSHVKGLFELQGALKESHNNLRKLLDTFVTHYRCLKNLGQPVEHWDTLLIYLISNKLDLATKKDWEASVKHDSPSIDDFIKFLTNKCLLLETLDNKQIASNIKTVTKGERSFSHLAAQIDSCPFCKGTHLLFHCKNFIALPNQVKYNEVTKLNLCTNCLKSGHFNRSCTSSCCKKCKGKHNTLLHFDSDEVSLANQSNQSCNETSSASKQVQNSNKMEPSISTHCTNSQNCLILLQPALVYILDSQGVKIKCRALLDSGSQSNFITTDLFNKLNIHAKHIDMAITGINSANVHISRQVQATIQSLHNSFKVQTSFLVLDKITGSIPSVSFNISAVHIPENITLADPDFNKSDQVDILLGAGIFFDLLCIGQIKTNKNQPILQKSRLGWIISGPLNNFANQNQISCLSLSQTNTNIDSLLEKF